MIVIDEIRKLLNTDKIIIGTDRTLKLLRKGELAKVFVSSNAEVEAKKDLEYYKKIGGVEVHALDVNNEELGTICGKPFLVSVIGVKK